MSLVLTLRICFVREYLQNRRLVQLLDAIDNTQGRADVEIDLAEDTLLVVGSHLDLAPSFLQDLDSIFQLGICPVHMTLVQTCLDVGSVGVLLVQNVLLSLNRVVDIGTICFSDFGTSRMTGSEGKIQEARTASG